MLLGASSAYAAASISASSSFTAADGVRTYMDVGGAWNGTTDVASTSGDSFSFALNNTTVIDGDISDDTAFEIAPVVSVPATFQFVGNSSVSFTTGASCAPLTAVTATQASAGADIVFAFTPAGYDILPLCTLTLNYGMVTTAAATGGSNTITPKWSFDDADGAGGTVSNGQLSPAQTIQVQQGDFIVSKKHVPASAVPAGGSGKIGTLERFDIEIGSSGAGGVFAVQVNDVLGAGFNGSLAFDDSVLPVGVTGTATGAAQYTFNYIPPGTTVTLGASSTISSCTAIDNTINVQDKLFATTAKTETSLDSITLNLENPNVVYNVPTINFDYTGGTPVATVNATVTNNGPGITDTVNLTHSNFPNGTVAVTAGPWTHNSGSSRFEYTGGNLAAGASANFTFTVTGTSCPFDPNSTQVTWAIEYTNGCNEIFTAVPALTNVTESNKPSLSLGKAASSRFMSTGQAGTYTISLSGVNSGNFAAVAGVDNDLRVVDQLPAGGIGNISVSLANIPSGVQVLTGATAATATVYTPGATIPPGHVIVIDADLTDLPLGDMVVDFVAVDQGGVSCDTGFPVINTATATVASCPGFSSGATAEIVPNEIVSGDFALTEDFVVVNTLDAPFEAGLADADGTRDAGEGEHINYRATYGLTDVRAVPISTWVGSKFTASLGTDETPALTTETVVTVGANDYSGFVRYQFADNGGALSAIADVPNSSISIVAGKLEIDLSYLGAGNTNADQLIIYYTTTASDSDISDGLPTGYVQRTGAEFLERVTLEVVGGTTGCSGNAEYTSAINVNVVRSDPEISATFTSSPGNGFVDVCEIIPVTVNIGAPGPAANPSYDLYTDNTRVQLDIGDSWRFVTAAGVAGDASTDIAYTGHITGATAAAVIGSGATTQLQIDTTPQNRAYHGSDGDSTALVSLQLQPGYNNKNLISRILFDDNQTRFNLSASRDFTKVNTNTSPKVRQAALTVTSSPDQVFLDDRTVRWNIFVQNTGTGVAYGASVQDTLPDLYSALINTAVGSGGDTTFNLDNAGLENATAPCYTNTAIGNVCGSVNTVNTVVWELGDIQPGATRTIQLTATIDPNTGACSINTNTPAGGGAGNQVTAQWGCGTNFITTAKVGPTFVEPSVNLQVLQDSSTAFCTLCAQGDLSLQIKNSGSGKLFNVTGVQDLGASGITYVPGSAMVSINGAAAVAAADPVISGVGGRTLTWSSTEITQLAELDNINGSGTNDVLISFKIQSPGESLATATDADKTVQASAGYEPACGATNAATSMGTAFVLPVHQPSVTIDKVGWNNSATGAAEGDASDTVYGGNGDQVIWRVTAANATGTTIVDAEDLVIRDFLSTANFNIDDYCVVGGAQNFTSCGAFTALGNSNDESTAPSLTTPQNVLTPGETQKFYFRGTVQALCDNPINTAEIEWGCPAEGVVGGLLATPLNDTARLVTSPDSSFGSLTVDNHSITWPGSGRGVVSFRITNGGGTARNISIADVVPAGFTRDTSVTPTITHSSSILDTVDISGTTTVTLNLHEAAVPFNTGTAQQNILRHNETAVITFGVLLDTAFETTALGIDDREETVGDGFDPVDVGTSLTNQVTINFENSCGAAQTAIVNTANNINPLLPDLDIDFVGTNLTSVVTSLTASQAYTVRVTNNGDGIAFADAAGVAEIQVVINIGLGWNAIAPAAFTIPSGGSCVLGTALADRQPYICTITSPINAGSSVDIDFTAQVDSGLLVSGQPLIVIDATVTGNLTDSLGVDTTNDYSLDAIRFRTIGFNVTKDILSCSENEDGATYPSDNVRQQVQIGEDCTFQFSANWFGAPGETITNISLQDNIQAGVGYVSHSLLPSSELTISEALRDNDTNPLDDGTTLVYGDQEDDPDVGNNNRDFYFHFNDHVLTAAGDDITLNLTSRILNQQQNILVGTNTEDRHNFNRNDIVVLRFSAFGATFDDVTIDANTTGYPAQNSIRRERVRSRTPNPTITKQIRNVTKDVPAGAGNYTTNVTGQAGDVLEYRIQVENTDSGALRMPLFDAIVTDTLDANLTILDFTSDGIDNDGDGFTDAADTLVQGFEGLVAGQDITFTGVNNQITNGAGRGLQKMDENDVVTLLVRATIDSTAVTGTDLTNTATIVGDTLLGDRGNAFDGTGASANDDDATGDIMGARRYTAISSPPARITIDTVTLPPAGSKVVTNLSLDSGGPTAFPVSPTALVPLNVVIGEEIQYRLSFIVPASTVPELVLTDTLPAGISCIEAPSVTLSPPNFVPGGTFVATCNAGTASWDFSNGGTISHVVAGTEAERTVSATFIARVDNEIDNVQGETTRVTNTNAQVSYKAGATTVTVDLDDAHLRVVEPSVTLTKAISAAPLTSVDAGDVLTVTVTAENTSADTSAYNVQIQDDLVSPERDLIYSANVNNTASLVCDFGSVNTATTDAPIFNITRIAPSSTCTFTFDVTVEASAQPAEILDDTLHGAWTSLPFTTTALSNLGVGPIGADGAVDGMRNGAIPNPVTPDTLNDYVAQASAQVTMSTPTVSKADNTLPAVIPSIGNRRQYSITVNLAEGTSNSVVVNDDLSAGDVSFILENDATFDVAYTLNNIASINGNTTLVTTADIESAMTSFPADEASGAISWNIGTIVTNTEDDQSTAAINPSIVITYFARINNDIDTDSSDSMQNSANLQGSHGETGVTITLPATSPAAITVLEPGLSAATKAVRNVTKGNAADFTDTPSAPDAGDILEYRIALTAASGANNSDVFDVTLVDTLPTGVIYQAGSSAYSAVAGFVSSSAGVASDNSIDNPDIAASILTWGLSAATPSDIDIQSGETIYVLYQVVVANTVLANQTLQNSVVPTWTSLDGVDTDERTGAGAFNDYTLPAITSSVTTSDNNDLAKTVVSDTFAAGNVRVGDIITYRLTLTLQEGTSDTLVINDELDAGLEFIDTLSIGADTSSPFAAAAPFSYTDLTAGAQITTSGAVATGQTISWNFGNLENAGDNSSAPASDSGTLVIEYRARVANAELAQTATTTLNNNADMLYNLATGAAPVEEAAAAVTLDMPILATTKAANPVTTSTMNAGDTITYTVTVDNSGNAPAYDIVVRDTLSAGLRAGGVPLVAEVTSITVNGVAATTFAPSAVGTFAIDGQIQWDFDNGSADDSEYTINAGQSMVIVYTVDVDGNVPPGVTLTNSANAENYYSFNDDSLPTGAVIADRESFAATTTAGTTHSTPIPGNLSKTGDKAAATIGEIVTYQLTIPSATFGAQLFDVVATDTLPANVTFVSAAYGTGNGAGVTDTLTTSVNGSNVLTINTAAGGFDVPANQQAVIDVQVRVNNTATENAGTSFQNSASYAYKTSDGAAASTSGGAAVQAPVVTIIEPSVSMTKLGRNITKGQVTHAASLTAPDAGDILEYQITLSASGAANTSDAFDVVINDVLPVGVAYNTGTSTISQIAASSAANNAITNPSISGTGVVADAFIMNWADSGTSGTANSINVPTGQSVTLTYQVVVQNTAQPGQVLVNSASASWNSLEDAATGERDGSGGVNDYSTTVATEPTAILENNTNLSKSVDGGMSMGTGSDAEHDYRVGDTVRYEIVITDVPEGTLNNFKVVDTLPAGLTYVNLSEMVTISGNFSGTAGVSVASSPQVLTWDFGNLVNNGESPDGGNDQITIHYHALITDSVGVGNVDNLTNTARVEFDVLSGVAGTASSLFTDSDSAAIDVPQPEFNSANAASMDKSIVSTSVPATADPTVQVGETVTFQIQACNIGGAPAYDVVVKDQLPAELDAGTPVINSVFINGVDRTTDYDGIGAEVDFSGGELSWTFDAVGDAVNALASAPNNCVIIQYTVDVDSDVGSAQSFNNSFTVDDYYSLDVTDNDFITHGVRRDFSATGAVTEALNTPTEVPTQLAKANPAQTSFTIGEEITYTLTIPGTGTVTSYLHDIEIVDTLSDEVEFVSVAFNAGNTGGTNGTPSGSVLGNTLTIDGFDISATNTATVDVTVRVRNTTGQNSGDSFTNTASYTYELTDGGTANNVPTGTAPVTPAITITESVLTTAKAVRNITRGDGAFPVTAPTAPDAGDILEYQVTVSHAATSTAQAFDINLVDTLGSGLSLDTGFTATATIGGASVGSFTAVPGGSPGPVLIWGRGNADENLDLPLATDLVVTYRVVVQNSVEPEQVLSNSAVVDWTSLNGTSVNERNNGAAPNDYITAPATSSITSRNDTAISKARTTDTFGAGDANVRVGDVVTFTVTATLQEGTTDAVVITDVLPVGLSYIDTVSIDADATAPYNLASPLTGVTTSTATNADTPAAGQTTLIWNFGTVVNEGVADANNTGNNSFDIIYRARVISTAGTSLTNDADLNYQLASTAAGTERSDSATLTVQKPVLATTKAASPVTTSTVNASSTITYTVTVANSGTAPAYDVVVHDTLSAGLRAGGIPTLAEVTSITVNGALAASLAPTAVATFAADGQIQWDFDNGSVDASPYTINAGQSMVVVYTVDVDADVAPGATLTNSANVQNYYSFNDDSVPAGSTVPDRQDFGATAAAGTTHSTPTPGNLSKTADKTTGTIGEIVTYQLRIPSASFGAQLFDVVATDTLPANVTFVSAIYGAGNGAGVTDVLTTSVAAGNVLTISTAAGGFDVPASQQAVIDVQVRVNNTATENIAGTFQNSASYTYEASNGGTANTSGGAAVQAPAVTIQEPNISAFAKAGRNITKSDPATFATFSAPDAGDILEYRLSFTADNAANRSDVFDLIVVDTLSAGLTYSGSLTITGAGNNLAAPDIAGQVLTWSNAATVASNIDIPAGTTVTATYQVKVADTVTAGQVLTNSATVDWSSLNGTPTGERLGTGGVNDYTLPAETSSVTVMDNTTFEKTVNVDSFATVTDGIVRIGDTIDFALTVGLNHGTTNNVVVTDTLPVGMEFVSTVSIGGDTASPYIGSSPFTFNTTTVPSVGQTNLTWNLGTVVNDSAVTPTTVPDDLVIIYRVRIADAVLAVAATISLQNNAALDYSTAAGAATQQTSQQTATVPQPILAMTKSTAAVSPVVAGQTITYTLRVENSGAAPAYDVQLQDIVPVGMRAGGVAGVAVTGVTINGGASVGTPAPAANASFATDGQLNWNLNAAGTFTIPAATAPAAPGVLELSYTIVVDSNVGTGISLQNSARVMDYFSFDDNAIPSTSALPDRQSFGAGALSSTTLTTPTPSVMTKTASPTGAAVGETVTYTLTVPGTTVNAALFDVDIADQLPAGLVCATANCNARFGPGNAATGAITATLNGSNLLTITNAAGGLDIPANQQAVILVDVVVSDTVGAANQVGAAGTTFSNSATYTYENTNNGASNLPGGAAAVASVTVEEPNLILTKQGPATIDLGGAPIGFTIWADNTGTSAAFNAVIQDQLPSQMRATTPASIAVARFDSIGGTQQALLTLATDYTVSYSSATGDLLITLLNTATAVVADNEVLRIQYNAQLDNVTGSALAALSGSNITNIAAATQWNSVASTNADGRSYSNALNTGTNADADDFQAAHTIAVNAPVLSLVKSVQNTTNVLSTPNADPGDSLRYSVIINNAGNITATVDFSDDIEALNPISVFVPNTLASISVAPAATPSAPTANLSSGTGGVKGTGLVAFTGVEVPAGGSRTISFDITLRNPLPNGSFAYNQASITAPFLTTPILSDSSSAADDDATNQGNGASLTDDDPVVTRIPAKPGLIVEKRDTDLNGGNLELGDTLRYAITVKNIGNENADNSFLTDAVPGNTTYVANSTKLNGVAVADIAGGSPLASGVNINSADTAVVGRVSGNQLGVATIEFDVTINTGLVSGTLISNQAIVTAQGAAGAIPTSFSDDPDTTLSGDPTQTTVGSAPFIDVKKIVGSADSPLLVGSILNYTFTISNMGNLAATGVTLKDSLPNNTSYVVGSTKLNGVLVADDASSAPAFTTATGLAVNNTASTAGTVAAGQLAVVTFQVTVDAGTAAGTVITNQGVVSSNELPDEKSDVDGNDENGDQPTEILFGTGPAIRVNKQLLDLNGGTVDAGDTVEYLIQISNIGNADATTVVVTDDLSALPISHIVDSNSIEGVAFTDSSTDVDAGDFGAVSEILTANIATLAPRAVNTIRFRAIVDSAVAGTVINNQANATDASGANVSDNATVMVGGTPGSANLSGQVWLDLDHDDVFDAGVEAPQQGWVVRISNGGSLVAEVVADANGNYSFNGLPPGTGYEVQFFFENSPASVGNTVSAQFTPVGQVIKGITLSAGDNILDQNLPIDPSGVIYDSVRRTVVAGVTLNMYFTETGGVRTLMTELDACLNPGQAGCPSNTALYEIEVSSVPDLYINGVSTSISPQTGPLDADTCRNGSGGDSIAATVDCEVAPINTQPTGSQPTSFFILFNLNKNGLATNVFNNHIPIDPILEGAVVLRKTTPKVNVGRGELVPYTITASISETLAVTELNGLEIRDTLPPGFKYVSGSARVNGVKQAPSSQVGRNFVWNNLTVKKTQAVEISMVLIVGAGVTENRYVNTAQAFNSAASISVSNIATATVRVVPDPTFDCTDIIGKVYDDADANGYQDKGEEALPAVRVATARGLLVTTDEHGRYHITCAAVPNEERGSNFILKLDERSLPSGYRVTTENPRVIRATRGKVAKANFGATIHRVVRLDLMDAAFLEDSTDELQAEWESGLEELLSQLQAKPSILRLVYLAQNESEDFAEQRLENIKALFEKRWEQLDCCYNLPIETNIYWRGYESRNKVNNNKKVIANGGAQ